MPALLHDPERLAPMGAAAAGLIPRDADEKLARIVLEVGRLVKVPVPDEILPAERLGHVHLVGIGGAGLSGIARIMLAPGHRGAAAATAPTRPPSTRCGRSARSCTSATTPPIVAGADTVVVSTAVREDNPEYVAARPAPASGCGRGRPRSRR